MVDIPVTERLRRLAFVIWATIGGLLLLWAGLWVAGRIRIIWLPLAFAAGMVIILDPIVRSFERIALPRVVGAFLAFLILAGVLVAVGFVVVPVIREQALEFGASLPGLYDETVVWLERTGGRLGFDLGPVWTSETIREWVQNPSNQETVQGLLGGFGSGAGMVLRGVAELVAVLGLAPVLAFYLLVDLPRSRRLMLELTPPRLRDEVAYVSTQVGWVLSAFVRGQLLVALIVGVMSSVVLRVLDVPFWLIIGLLAGLLNMVPFIGPFVGGALAALVALLEGEFTTAVIAVVAFVAIQQIDNHLITPIVQRTRVRLSPVVIVLALVAGGSVAGLLGVLVAVPVVSVVRTLAGHVWRTRVLGESWEEASEALIEVTPAPERFARRRQVQQARLFDTAELGPVERSDESDRQAAVRPGATVSDRPPL